MTAIRRDERAEPDDEDSSPRIDVVNVDAPASMGSPRSEGTGTGMSSLKAQLARLNEQAAAVEKSLDDQRRDRSDALERLERATERCVQLEAKLAGFEAETASLRRMHEASQSDLHTMRAERDGLERAVEAAKIATAEIGTLKDKNEALHATLEESMRAAATFEGDLVVARTTLERATAELTESRAAAAKAKDDAAKARETASLSEKETAVAREEAMQAREATAKAENTISMARAEGTKARGEASKLRQELAHAKEDNAKDRATARDRIDLLERALDDARATNSRTEGLLETSRENEEALARQLEVALVRAADAETRATAASGSQAALEQNVRRLREEIVGAFARIGHGAAPPPLPPAARPEARVAARDVEAPQSFPPELLDSVPPSMRPEAPPMPAIPSARPPSEHPALALELDNDWSSPESGRSSPSPGAASPASKSVPPPPSAAEEIDEGPGSIPPPTYASVPPQLHDVSPPVSAEREASPTAPPPATHSVPAAALGSVRPGARDSAAPATRRGGPSAFPSATSGAVDLSREQLLARLTDADHAEEAAHLLKLHPEWLRSVPPSTFIETLQSVDYDADRPIFELARQWEREPLCHALIASLRSEPDARLREHGAWLLKHLAAPSSWKAIADLARSEDEGIQLRRWLLEALDRLAAGRAIGWRELGDVVTTVSKHPDPSLRDGVVGILVSLDRSDEKRRLLVEILRADDDEVVIASAVDALAGALPVELDPGLVERLLGHPSPRVQRSVRDLIERAKPTKS